MDKSMISEVVMIIVGAFLLLDGLFLHAVVFDYNKYGIAFLDPYISHTLIGALLLALGIYDMKS